MSEDRGLGLGQGWDIAVTEGSYHASWLQEKGIISSYGGPQGNQQAAVELVEANRGKASGDV